MCAQETTTTTAATSSMTITLSTATAATTTVTLTTATAAATTLTTTTTSTTPSITTAPIVTAPERADWTLRDYEQHVQSMEQALVQEMQVIHSMRDAIEAGNRYVQQQSNRIAGVSISSVCVCASSCSLVTVLCIYCICRQIIW